MATMKKARVRLKKRYQGKAPYRYRDNPMERCFALAWQSENDRPGNSDSLLKSLMGDGSQPGEVTPRDRLVAATLIQWLGSTCGQFFLSSVLLSPAMRDEALLLTFKEGFDRRLKKSDFVLLNVRKERDKALAELAALKAGRDKTRVETVRACIAAINKAFSER
jgi:hypothetical protein